MIDLIIYFSMMILMRGRRQVLEIRGSPFFPDKIRLRDVAEGGEHVRMPGVSGMRPAHRGRRIV
jgi:hypothetical protein